MEFQTIKVQLGESMAWINLDRPEVRNAFNPPMISELTDAFDWLNNRDDIRVIILKGNGKAFCAGADLNYMKEMASFSFAQNLTDANHLSNLFKKIYFCNKAVIADVHGAVMGGANGLIAACDIVIAEQNTVFAFSEVRLGLTPATISPFVIARMGETTTRELMLTGRRFSAQEAKEYHLVNIVVAQDEMIDTERKYIDYFLQASPYALAECKQLLRAISERENPHDDIFMRTATAIAQQRASEDGQEGIEAFFEKRPPKWQHG